MFPSSEIYDGLSATYDHGPYGGGAQNNIRQYWWAAMVRPEREIVGIDSCHLHAPHHLEGQRPCGRLQRPR